MKFLRTPSWIRIGVGTLCAAPISLLAVFANWLAFVSIIQLLSGMPVGALTLAWSMGGICGTAAVWSFVLFGIGAGKLGYAQLCGLLAGITSLGVIVVNTSGVGIERVFHLVPFVTAIACSVYIAARVVLENRNSPRHRHASNSAGPHSSLRESP